MNLAKSRQDIFALCEIERSMNLLLLHPLIHAELIADVAALNDQEFFVEFFLKFALPLKREVRRTDDQDSLREASQLQFRIRSPAMMVLPAPASSARRKRTRADLRR